MVRDFGLLGGASIANGLFSYAFVALGTRSFGPAAFAPLSVVWTVWALGVAALAFPFQHRMTVLHEMGVSPLQRSRERRRLLGVSAVASALLVAALWMSRQAVFGTAEAAYPLLAGLVVLNSAWLGIVRGDLAGTGRTRRAALVLVLEQGLRVSVGGVLLAMGVGVVGYGWSMAAAVPLVALWQAGEDSPSGADRPTRLGGYLASVSGGSLLGQLVLTGSPALLSVLGGAPQAVTALFTTLAVARAPYLIGQGAAIKAMSDFARSADRVGRSGLRVHVVRICQSTLGAVMLVGVVATLIGGQTIELVFGAGSRLAAGLTGTVAVGAILATGSLFLLLVLIAAQRVAAVAVARTLGIAAFTVVALAGPHAPVTNIVVGFGVSEAIAFGALAWSSLRATRRGDAPAANAAAR